MKGKDLLKAIDQIGFGRKVDKSVIIKALESAIVSALKKISGVESYVRIEFENEEEEIKVYAKKKVVTKVIKPIIEITLSEAKKIKEDVKLNDEIEVEIALKEFGRIASQIAKQVVLQKMQEAETNEIYNLFKDKIGTVVSGTVFRKEDKDIIIDLKDTEGLLLRREQIFKENLTKGKELKVYIIEVKKTANGPQVIVSRTHPKLLKKLLELEIPEIADNTIEVKAVGREPGYRAKVAVISNNKDVNAVATCIGPRANRIQNVVRELNGEKIDIIEWSDDIKTLIANSISPAEISKINIYENIKRAEILVPDDTLTLAIGKKGQNARLTSKLTGWRIDITSKSKLTREKEDAIKILIKLNGVGKKVAEKLFDKGFATPKIISSSSVEELMKVEGVQEKLAQKIFESARELTDEKKNI